MSSAQISLFDLLAALAPAAEPTRAPAETMHYVAVTTRRAMTACGMIVSGLDWKARQWLAESGASITCTVDRYSGDVTCPRCKEHMW